MAEPTWAGHKNYHSTCSKGPKPEKIKDGRNELIPSHCSQSFPAFNENLMCGSLDGCISKILINLSPDFYKQMYLLSLKTVIVTVEMTTILTYILLSSFKFNLS